MQDTNHALAALADTMALSDIDFGPEGRVEIIVNDVLSVYLVRVSDKLLEVCSPIPSLKGKLDGAVMRALLVANSLGDGTGAGRLALDGKNDAVMLCERVDVTTLDATALEARLLDFIKLAAFWNGEGATDVLSAAPVSADDDSLSLHTTMLRI